MPKYRKDPIPKTGRFYRISSSMFRQPRTNQERKYANEFSRARRRRQYLPTTHSDIFIKTLGCKNWKRYRKTQYKPIDKSHFEMECDSFFGNLKHNDGLSLSFQNFFALPYKCVKSHSF